MHTINFAKIRNAKALLLTPDKRVLHFPATNKVRIDNILPDELYYRSAAQRSNRKEYANANTAALETGLVPPVQNYRERGNLQTYTQDYAGKALPRTLRGIAPKEQYKLGSQVGRIQNRLREQNLGHADIHEGNIARPNPKRSKVQLIDNDAIKTVKNKYDEAEIKNMYDASIHSLGKPFMTGYNSRINFTQQKQMQHFANFNVRAGLDAIKKVGAKVGGLNSVKVGAGVGAAAGLVKGAGIGESEEEKSKTTALGRVGKLVGNTAVGGVVGGGLGMAAGDVAKGLKRQYKKSEIELTPPKISNNSYGYNPNANFAAPMLDNSHRYLKNIKAGGMAVGDVVRGLGNEAYRPSQIAAAVGGLAGLARGAGVGETEEEKANTTALGRAGKIFGNAAAGTAIGGTLGLGGQGLAASTKYAYNRRRPEYDVLA